jgi:hypothetical protein
MTDSDHIMQLRQQVANLHGLLLKTQAERDEARREVCAWQSGWSGKVFKDTAAVRGWDCFKENP